MFNPAPVAEYGNATARRSVALDGCLSLRLPTFAVAAKFFQKFNQSVRPISYVMIGTTRTRLVELAEDANFAGHFFAEFF